MNYVVSQGLVVAFISASEWSDVSFVVGHQISLCLLCLWLTDLISSPLVCI